MLGSGVLAFQDPENTNMDGSLASGTLRGSDIIVSSAAIKGGGQEPSVIRPSVVCGTSKSGWVYGAYRITGPVCACNAAFVAGTAKNCSSCANGFDTSNCKCGV